MQQKQNTQQMRALQVLLSIDQSPQNIKHKQNQTEPIHQAGGKRYFQRGGKENQSRRQILPPLNNSKEQLKLILRKLQQSESFVKTDKRVKAKRKDQSGSHTVAIKSNRQRGILDSPTQTKKDINKSILQINKGDDIRTMMRQNNYSTNALNLKTLNILQQINSKNYKVSASRSAYGQNRTNKKNMLTFLRRVA